MTDKQYIEALQEKNELVFTHLYESCRGPFFGFIRKHYGKNDDYITDLYQDACVAMWENIQKGKLTPDNLTCSLQTYLNGIGKFKLMARDRKYREMLVDQEFDLGGYSVESLRDEIERDEIVLSTVNKMQEPCRTLLDKYYWEELSGEEIATQMNYKNTDTVKTQKYKCMQKLKTVLAQKLQDFK